MAYFMVHLSIAQKIYEQHPNIEDKGALYLGAIAPDAVAFKPGYKRSDKKHSHFCIGDEDWGGHANCDEWKDNLTISIERYKGQVSKDFLHGYFSHVIADIETTRLFYVPVRDKHDDKLMEKYAKDCAEAEAILLSKYKNLNELWALLYQSNQYCIPDFFTCHDLSSMIDYMKNKLYSNLPINLQYQASVYSINDFTKFIESTAEAIDILYR